jgi:DNA polymerase I-like protein with 3'-5' exonuclease and polymerase domains
MQFGDERGFFWKDIKKGDLPGLPKRKGGERQDRAHRGREGNAGTSLAGVGTPGYGPPPESVWSCPTELPRLHDCTIAVDVETWDRTIKSRGAGWCFPEDGGEVLGIAIAWPGGQAYFPFSHPEAGADQLTREHVMAWLRDLFADPTVTVCCYSALYDIGWCMAYGCGYPKGMVHDGFVMASLLDEHRRSYKLDAVAKDYGFAGKDEGVLRKAAAYYHLTDLKSQLRFLPARYVGPYAEADAVLARELVIKLSTKIESERLLRVYALEMAQLPILIAMRNNGVAVDTVGAELLVDRWAQEQKTLEGEIKRLVGFDVPVWEAQAIAKACEATGVVYPFTAPTDRNPHGQPSFTAGWLTTRAEPWLQHVLTVRTLDKAGSTFAQGYILDMHVKGRVHCQFNSLRSDDGGTVSGRYSSSYPNLQNIPTRNKLIGPAMRALFLPEPGEFWCAADYSQQEPRLTVHYADVINCVGAAAAVEQYKNNPDMDYHQFMATLTGLDRDSAKTINLAAAYGMGAVTLCHRLGLPTVWVDDGRGNRTEAPGEEGLRIMQQYHANAPFVQQLNDACQRKARADKVIKTIAGRRCRFPAHESPHKAMNRLIQGSAADMMKAALVAVHREGFLPLVTVHDEIGISVPDQATGNRVAEIMRDAMPLRVPLLVDAGLGANWWCAKHPEITT